MSDQQKKQLEQQLWNIADTLRGKMGADEFRDYILGFIFYKYLSEKQVAYANKELAADGIIYADMDETTEEGAEIMEGIKEMSVENLGFFLKPSELFSVVVQKGKDKGNGV